MEGARREKSETALQAKICKYLVIQSQLVTEYSNCLCRKTGRRRPILIQNLQKRTQFLHPWTQKLPKQSNRWNKNLVYKSWPSHLNKNSVFKKKNFFFQIMVITFAFFQDEFDGFSFSNSVFGKLLTQPVKKHWDSSGQIVSSRLPPLQCIDNV